MLAILLSLICSVHELVYSHAINADGVVVAAYVSQVGLPDVVIPIDPSFDPTAPPDTPVSPATDASTLSTPVYDAISDTYTDIVTTKGKGETNDDVVRRHDDLVHAAVRNKKADAKHEGLDYDALKKAHDERAK